MLGINKEMFIYKFHYFFFQAGIGPTQTAMPVYAQTLGFSSFIVGTIYTILPLAGLVIKPAFGALADKFRWHMFVMLLAELVIMLSYFSAQFIPSDFHPNNTQSTQTFCSGKGSLYMCPGESIISPHLLLEPFSNDSCSVKCEISAESWTSICSSSQLQPFCDNIFTIQSNVYAGDNCKKIPTAWLNDSVDAALCSAAQSKSSHCRKQCGHAFNADDDNAADDDEEEEYQDDSVTFGQYQFYVFIVLMIGSFCGTAVTTTIADTICVAKNTDPVSYGKQRLWGSLGYGVLSVVSGLIVDGISETGQPKNYLPAFYLTLGVLLLDLAVTSFYMKSEIKQQSSNMAGDVVSTLLRPRVMVFLVWCAAMGVSLGLTWTFLYWLLEDLAKSTGPDTVASIKTIEGLTNGVQTFLGETPAFFFAGWVITKIGHGHTMSVILFTIGLRFTIYSFLSNPWYVLFVEPLQLYYGLFYSTMTSYANINCTPGTAATMQSIMCAVCEGIGVAIGSFLGGLFYDWYGGLTCFRIFGISFFVMAVMNETIEFAFRHADKNRKDKQVT